MEHSAYLSLGSNRGNKKTMLQEAVSLLNKHAGIVKTTSSIYTTEAWGNTNQPDFYNICLQLLTTLSPNELLEKINAIEHELGRERIIKWGERTIDIDILMYNNTVIDSPELTIPHKLMTERNFVLLPLSEIAEEIIHPILHKKIRTLLEECPDTLKAIKIDTLY